MIIREGNISERRNSLSSHPSSKLKSNPLHLPPVSLGDRLSPTSPNLMSNTSSSMFSIGASPLMPTTTSAVSYNTLFAANGTSSPVRVSGTEMVVASVSTNGNKMTVTDLCNGHEYDQDGLLAAEALAGLKNGGMTGHPYSTLSQPTETHMQHEQYQHQSSPPAIHQEHFMQRVSNIPIVNKSINQIGAVYEAGKNTSRIVRYSAETVETGVKSISGPILDKLEPALAPLDRFACNQLDRLERAVPSVFSPVPGGSPVMGSTTMQPHENGNADHSRYQNGPQSHIVIIPRSNMMVSSPQTKSYLHPPVSPGGFAANGTASSSRGDMMLDHKPRSAWQTALGGVSSMVLSDETMRALKYCLQWLQYATSHIERQIAILRDYLARAGNHVVGLISGNQPTPPLSPSNELTVSTGTDLMTVVVGIKREIVDTLRKVVDVIGRYAAAYLPGDARTSVRGFILSLPTRWATLNGSDPSANGNNNNNSAASTEAHKVLTLAGESSNMLKSVTNIFTQTVDGAERLMGRVVGMGSYGTVPSAIASTSYTVVAALPPAANSSVQEDDNHTSCDSKGHRGMNGVLTEANGHHVDMDVEEEEEYDDAEEPNKSMEIDW